MNLLGPPTVLALALSLDGFVAGVAYGMRRVQVPFSSLLVVSLCTGVSMLVSMSLGRSVSGFVSFKIADAAGGGILVAIGIWRLVEGWAVFASGRRACAGADTDAVPVPQPSMLLSIRIHRLGLVVQILKEPMAADLDRSGRIDVGEALMLGIALSLDALAAGFAAGMMGFTPAVVPLVSLGGLGLLSMGVAVGRRVPAERLGGKGMLIPGILLILLGVTRL